MDSPVEDALVLETNNVNVIQYQLDNVGEFKEAVSLGTNKQGIAMTGLRKHYFQHTNNHEYNVPIYIWEVILLFILMKPYKDT